MSDEATLRAIVRDFHWQARRYMDGRRTGAKQFNDHTRALLAMGVPLNATGDGTLWARDADGRAYDGLTDAEAAQGRPFYEHTIAIDLEPRGIVLPEPEPYDGPPLSDEEMEALLFDDEPPPEAWRALAEQRGALLGALVAKEPIAYEERGARCVMCDGEYDRLPHGAMGILHAASCPWVAAKELVR